MPKAVERILRVGLAFSLIYPAVSAYLTPTSWIGYFPQFARELVSNDLVLLHSFGAIEIGIALWLLSGWRIFWSSLVAAALLVLIILFNTSQMDVVFRDISLLAMALALMQSAKSNRP